MSIRWITFPALRNASGESKILTDIKSHVDAGQVFSDSDLVTVAHETTHAINAAIRQKYGGNGFYVLNDKAISIEEPSVTLGGVAQQVPHELRGDSYNLYLVQQVKYWNEQPLYILDEWTAYTNGSDAGLELQGLGKDQGYQEATIRQMLEFGVYVLTLAKSVTNVTYNDKEKLKEFISWQFERAQTLLKKSRDFHNFTSPKIEQYLKKYAESDLKEFADTYLNEKFDYGSGEYI